MWCLQVFDGSREADIIKQWLIKSLPNWSNFKIALAAKYLGFYLGPRSAELVWKAPIAKWKTRAREIARSHLSPLLAAVSYNSRAISVLGYISQLTPPPPAFETTERALLHHMLHLPTNSFEHRTFFHLDSIGCKIFVSVQAFCDASLARAASKTIIGWQGQYDWLTREASEHLPLSELSVDACAHVGGTPCLLSTIFSRSSMGRMNFGINRRHVLTYVTSPTLAATLISYIKKDPFRLLP